LQRAYRRAARSAFLWEGEMRDLVAQKRPPTGNCDTFLPPAIAFLNPAMPQHESAPFLRIFGD
jgi:hypothetical protein